jgi:hypothetical protein
VNGSTTVELRTAEPPAAPDVYFTRAYGVASAVADEGEWVSCSTSDGRWQVPLVLRPVADGDRDAVSPYGYAGIHADPGLDADTVRACWEDTVRALRSARVISAFLRFSPMPAVAWGTAVDLPMLRPQHRGATVSVDTRDTEVTWNGMKGRSRTAIRKAEKSGLTGTVRPIAEPDLAPGSPFRRLYESTMARLGSRDYYQFPGEYYGLLRAGLGTGLRLAEVVDGAGEPVAAALVMIHGGYAHYHLAGSEPAAARLGANNLLVWSLCRWAGENGIELVHLGGGIDGGGLMAFKESFGGTVHGYYTGEVVLDEDRYALQTSRRAAELGRTAGELTESGFFPAYRAHVGGE